MTPEELEAIRARADALMRVYGGTGSEHFTPETVLALLAELERREEEAERLRATPAFNAKLGARNWQDSIADLVGRADAAEAELVALRTRHDEAVRDIRHLAGRLEAIAGWWNSTGTPPEDLRRIMAFADKALDELDSLASQEGESE